MNPDDNPYAVPQTASSTEPSFDGADALHIDNWWYAVGNLLFGRVIAALIALEALWNALTSIMSMLNALNAGAAPHRILYLQLMFSLLWLVMMGILYARRGRGPIAFWCDLGDRIVFGRLAGPAEYDWSQAAGFDYEGIGNRTRIAVARAPVPVEGRRILVVSLTSGTEFRLKVHHDQGAKLKQLAMNFFGGSAVEA